MSNKIRAQRGATLIVVLFIVLLIMIVCAIAVKKSMGSLSLATSQQAQELMFQSSEAYLLNFTRFKDDDKNQDLMNSVFGLGQLSQEENQAHEIAFCYDSTMKTIFDVSKITVSTNKALAKQKNGLTPVQIPSNTIGFCKANQFATARNAVITQVYMKSIKAETAFDGINDGTDDANIPEPKLIRIYVISVIPALVKNPNDIQTCFSHYSAEKDDNIGASTVVDCLKLQGIPYSAQVADYSKKFEFPTAPAKSKSE